ncbi:MAG: hypothetical protein IKQ37_01205 [Bacteroidaceae bacterium]|nr:hypothetical protein [Bacteroidaceae bacterium]
MKQFLFLVAAFMVAMCAKAQKIEVVDSDGNGVPYAMVLTPEAECLGSTGLDGVFADVKGAKAVTISHVAFKPKEVIIDGKDVRVVLEDANFALDEIVVSPKPLVYVQTYYRVFFYENKHGIVYYRAGLTDNVYDRQTGKVKASTKHFSTGYKSFITKLLNTLIGWWFDNLSEIRTKKIEDNLIEKNKDIELKISQTSPGHWIVNDLKGTVGTITDDKQTGWRRIAVNSDLMERHRLEAKGKKKDLAKRDEIDKKTENEVKSEFIIYHVDEDGNYSPEDFVMLEFTNTFDYEYKGEKLHCITGLQTFSTDRAYVTKDELKQRQAANKQQKLSYQDIQQFERKNNIPALAPVVSQAIEKLK